MRAFNSHPATVTVSYATKIEPSGNVIPLENFATAPVLLTQIEKRRDRNRGRAHCRDIDLEKRRIIRMAEMRDRSSWNDEDTYWQTNYRTRPYASDAGRDYDFYRPGYRYGYDAANRYQNRNWNDVEADLSRDWSSYEHRGTSTWEQMKHAVRDAWDRVTGNRPVGAR